MKNLLITGSGGFIGGNLKEFLTSKYNLYTPRSFELNLCNAKEVEDYFNTHSADFIIHCATTGGVRGEKDKDTTVEDNLMMVENILNFKKKEARVILFGSGAMYDRFRNLHKVREEEIGKHIPSELYGKSKMLIAQKIQNREDVICLNIFGCYGKREKTSRFPSYAISQNLKKEKIIINRNVIFDYLYINDLIKIIEYFIENNSKYRILNVTPTKSISLLEIAELVNKISDYKSEIEIIDKNMNFEYTGSNQRLLEIIPDFCFTEIEDGLTDLYKRLS